MSSEKTVKWPRILLLAKITARRSTEKIALSSSETAVKTNRKDVSDSNNDQSHVQYDGDGKLNNVELNNCGKIVLYYPLYEKNIV